MKMFNVILYVVLLLFLGHTMFSEENLIKNGDFEESDGKLPFFWETNTWKSDKDIVKFYLEKSNSNSDGYYFTIENFEEDDSKLLQNVRVKPNTYYKLSCMIRAEGIGMEHLGANITVLDVLETSKDHKNTNGKWEYTEVYGITGPNQEEMAVSLRLGGYGNTNTGKASFDDVKLVELESRPDNVNIINFYRENMRVDKREDEGKVRDKDKSGGASKKKSQNAVPLIVLIILFFLLLFYIVYEYFIKKAIKGKSEGDEKRED